MASMNTKICYLYRDADNYKIQNTCIVSGRISTTQIVRIMECLDGGEYFIPRQVGLPERRFDQFDPNVDHCWFELGEDGFEYTDRASEVNLTVEQLVDNFQAAKGHWNDNWMKEAGLL